MKEYNKDSQGEQHELKESLYLIVCIYKLQPLSIFVFLRCFCLSCYSKLLYELFVTTDS